ncbi:Methyl-CpG-binding domain-containing protein 8 [Apostasia shenzhenica]|uniref:Methyl-CpG-binding domain-containing protein 8 n=1 Tax=Apostasia shenzhenica TaxID=1088818 RepID=A0A2I0A5E3_9ASPA|nr:Methyl-CpG-binding domain-containing protein 8 [Apostasia shenzhenica]
MATELIPVVDLRVLSQSELSTLALSSPSAFDLGRCEDVVVPKIDRSVFNESAGSRKQTYSRLNLAPPKSDSQSPSPSLPRRRGRPRSIPMPAAATTAVNDANTASYATPNDPDRRENLLIASFLRKLFAREDPSSKTLAVDSAASSILMKEENEVRRNVVAAAEEAPKALVLFDQRDREALNSRGEVVDLVALGHLEDPFGKELLRRTEGLRTEEQLLGFLSQLEGQWGSRRKRRKIVDASLFGDVLPRGWKVLLGLKRKEGVAWLNCRRYVSPNGKQFISCQEVSQYILSQQSTMHPVGDQVVNNFSGPDKLTIGSNVGQIYHCGMSSGSRKISSASSVSHASNNNGTPISSSCYNAVPISCISSESDKQQPFSSNQRSAKKRKLGNAMQDGVILKDEKYKCQFCQKTFKERHRYNGHVSAHVQYQGIAAEAVPKNFSASKSKDQTSWAVVPYNNISAVKNDERLSNQSAVKIFCATENVETGHNRGINKLETHEETTIPKSVVGGSTEEIIKDRNGAGIHDRCLSHTELDRSPLTTEESSKLAHNEVKDDGFTTNNNDDDSIRELKRNVSSNGALLLSTDVNENKPIAPDSIILSPSICETADMSLSYKLNKEIHNPFSTSKSNDAATTYPATLDDATSYADKVALSPSMSKSTGDLPLSSADVDNRACESGSPLIISDGKEKIVGDSINDASQNFYSTSNFIDAATTSCYVSSVSLVGVDAKNDDEHNEVHNDKNVVECQNHLMTLFGNEQGSDLNLYTKHIFTDDVEKLTKEPTCDIGEDDSGLHLSLSDKNTFLLSSLQDTLQSSYPTESLHIEQTQDTMARTDLLLHTDMNRSFLQEINRPINELEMFFHGSNLVQEGNTADEMISNNAPSEAVQVALADSSWMQATEVPPVLNMLPDQCGDELEEISQKNENFHQFDDLRLGTMEPADFALFTGLESRTVVEPTMTLGYDSELEDRHFSSSLQLGWDISSSNIDSKSCITSVCVWCNAEFSHELELGQAEEPQQESLGYICPACKAKFTGPSSIM